MAAVAGVKRGLIGVLADVGDQAWVSKALAMQGLRKRMLPQVKRQPDGPQGQVVIVVVRRGVES